MKVLFINYSELNSNSGIQIFNIANHLTKLGVECIFYSPKDSKFGDLERRLFKVASIEELTKKKITKQIDLIHSWTPREITRKATAEIRKIYPCPYVVHLEDNEEYIIQSLLKIPFNIIKKIPKIFLNILIQPHMSHPIRYRNFLEQANGISMINEKLSGFCPKNIPHQVIWAGYQEDIKWDLPKDNQFKLSLGISEKDFVITYTGNGHRVNESEISDLYESIGLLNGRGVPVKLIRTGINYGNRLGNKQKKYRDLYSIELGFVERALLPKILSISDVLIQPGKSNDFNNYRFPSKLPEYFASGKPVVLPKSNIGLHLQNGKEGLLLEEGSPNDIAEKIQKLLFNPLLRNEIGKRGQQFAEKYLKWDIQAKKIFEFYQLILHHSS